jgi:hypothetical protein
MTTIDLVLVIRVLRVESAKTANYAKQAQIKVSRWMFRDLYCALTGP